MPGWVEMEGVTPIVGLGRVQNVAQEQEILEPEGSWFSVRGQDLVGCPKHSES